MRRAFLGIALALAFTAPAAAQQGQRARLITEIDATAFADAFPPVALATAVSGRAVLECAVAADGSSQCQAVEETPAGAGFGAAAEALAADWRFSPRMEGEAPVASVLRVPVEFQNSNEARLPISNRFYVDGLREERVADAEPMPEGVVERATCGWSGPTNCARSRFVEPSENAYFFHHIYPENARQQQTDGYALVACAMRSNRQLDCRVEGEAPEGFDFGLSTIRLVSELAEHQQDSIAPGAVFRVASTFEVQNRRTDRPRRRSPWEDIPTVQSFSRVYPQRALDLGIEGRVELSCEILSDRRLNCYDGSEHPSDSGFGGAAVYLSREFRLERWAVEIPGYRVGERIIVPITFRVG